MSSSSVSSSLPEDRRRDAEPRWLLRGVVGGREALEGDARVGDRIALRVREGEGETGSCGRGARASLDGPGVVVSASDELGGVGRPPGASSLACRRLILPGLRGLEGLRGADAGACRCAGAALVLCG